MRELTSRAKDILEQGEYTCVIIKNDDVYTSKERGVKPLLGLIYEEVDFKDSYAADKVVGKAAAFLYVMLGIKEVYVGVISKPAVEILGRYGIEVVYGELVEAINNRTNTGFCPMESAVWDIDNPQDALKVIEETRKMLSYKNKDK